MFEVFGVDAAAFLADLDAAGDPADGILIEDRYADVVPALAALVSTGHQVAVAANQPARAAADLAALDVGVPLEVLVLSGIDGVAKPDPALFRRVVKRAGRPASDITYVGDRLDNDVLPALAAGMRAVLVRRGPWGVLHARRPEAARATAVVDSLAELVPLLGGVAGGAERVGRRSDVDDARERHGHR